MSEHVKVTVNTDVESYPVLVIGEVGSTDHGYDVPAELMKALAAAEKAVADAEQAVMRHIARENPEARDIVDWVRDRDNEPKWHVAVSAYAADHPDGPSWERAADATRKRYLTDAGYEIWRPAD